ncbi:MULTISPECIES: hypothetical protein [Pseudomonas]|jgi:hypothetical protein|uniref:Uncharacterized protein n=1 Tax=Pseudomonas mandelii TaxID=75612 RepID=A0AB36CWR4_9PSED|nr:MULTISPECIES: hypothetical protein [Pseudomonas]NMZ80314.1 hypothetical protein [Pseudomonas mandelii]QQO01035.1 hypothetical protein JIO00_10965 [Pseudomonas sp. SW-3]
MDHDLSTAKTRLLPGRTRQVALFFVACCVTGCTTMGPNSIQRDRTDYSAVIASTWKEQTLLNIVKLRYADAPVFLEVSSVIASSAMQSQVSLAASWYSGFPSDGNSQAIGASGVYTDRPTISYTPLSGERFSRYLLQPLSPAAVFSLIQAGYPIDRVLQLTTSAVNGVYNRSTSPSRFRAADPRFYELLEAFRRIQRSESLGMRINQRSNDESMLVLISRDVSDDIEKDRRKVRELLHLSPDASELNLKFGMVQQDDTEVVLLTRSMSEIFVELAATIEVPPAHVQEGRANPAPAAPEHPSPWDEPLVRIHSSRERPIDAYAAVRYRDYWFWIDDRDMKSKSEFLFILVLFSLAETGVAPQTPVITVPAN